MNECCENCKFWLLQTNFTVGQCRRHAPSNDYQMPWPQTKPTDLCGEFEVAAHAVEDKRQPAGEAIMQSAAELLASVRGSQYGLQYGSGAIREGRKFNQAEMAVTIMALDRLAKPLKDSQHDPVS